MKRVLFMCNVPVPYRMEFFRQLSKYVDLTVIFEAQSGKFQYNYDYNATGFRVIFADKNGKRNETVYLLETRNNYDYIIVVDWLHAFWTISYLKIKQIPYYIEVDGAILHQDNLLKKIYKTYLIKGAKGYFSTSESSDRYFMRYGAKKELIKRYAFSSVTDAEVLSKSEDEEQKKRIKKELGIDTKEKIVIGVGRYIHRKGFDTLIKAIEPLQRICKLILIGGKPTEEYQSLIENLKIKNVQFIDFIQTEDLNKYYKIADVFVLPTREEVWGLVINEAMAQGCPVITTDNCVAGLELVKNGENGFIFPVDNVSMLSNYIQTILEDSSLQNKMSEKCLQTIREYTIEKMVKDHMLEFEDV